MKTKLNIYVNPDTKKKLSIKSIKKFSGIPDLFFNDGNHLTDTQSIFYDKIKFPYYDNTENFGGLFSKVTRSDYVRKLDEEIPYFANVLEAGCGTGQLSIMLSRFGRKVFGIDLSKGSLKEGKRFIDRNDLKNIYLSRMNIFKLCFPKDFFDIIISNGVLHHTDDPQAAFAKLTECLKPGGYVVIGLYHKYGRITHKLKKILVNNISEKFKILDSRLAEKISKAKKDSWFKDQYLNPHESTHTFKEILDWFNTNSIEYINSLPFDFDNEKKIFTKNPQPAKFKIFFKEILLCFDKYQIKENGFFVMIGKKKN